MEESMNQAEVLTEQVEQKMLYKFLVMINEAETKGKTMEDLADEVKAMIK